MPARILIVEDNATNLELMAYLLTAFGHIVARASDGAAGLEAARKTTFDLILADVLMPKVDGYEFVRRVKLDAATCPAVVAVTALAMVGDRERVLQSGFDGYIAKPINPETFVHEVDRFLPGELKSTPQKAGDAGHAAPPNAAQARTGRTILVVDDVAANTEVVRAALEPFGHRVLEARSMQAAVDLAVDDLPDLVLADVNMPDGSGYDLIKAFKANEKLAAVPFIFLTSTYWHELDIARGISLGADKFLLRPIEPHVLLEEVNGTLSKSIG